MSDPVETLRLCGRNVQILLGDSSSWDSNSYGRSDVCKGVIYLSRELDKDGRLSVKVHEVIHFIADSMELNLNEKQVAGLEVALLAALRDNPSWVREFIDAKA